MIRSSLLVLTLTLAPAAAAAAAMNAPAPVHCQVPCGIFGDSMRIDMLMEHAATIEKSMAQITELQGDPSQNANQLVRWVTTKEEHAAEVQEMVASYWLAQRIKAPTEESDAALNKYHQQLSLLHGMTIAAMKSKQTTDPAHVAKLRSLTHEFAGTYFAEEDLKHMQLDHGGEHR